jgi:hypothetical protein
MNNRIHQAVMALEKVIAETTGVDHQCIDIDIFIHSQSSNNIIPMENITASLLASEGLIPHRHKVSSNAHSYYQVFQIQFPILPKGREYPSITVFGPWIEKAES